jgi:hypothetical protein
MFSQNANLIGIFIRNSIITPRTNDKIEIKTNYNSIRESSVRTRGTVTKLFDSQPGIIVINELPEKYLTG